MLKRIFILLIIVSFLIGCRTDNTGGPEPDNRDILDRLRSLEGVEVVEVEAAPGFARSFEVDVLQPVDHNNPKGPVFRQRVFLNHQDPSLPMIMATSGYGSSRGYRGELSLMMQSNTMSMPHRYFSNALPDTMDWQYLTVRQAAADHHRIVSLFKSIYPGKWITTGGSKGGMTALFHRRHYPGDVDVTVAYVAPIMLGYPDPRFDQYLLNVVGDDACRARIRAFQRRVLEHRDDMLQLLADYQTRYGVSFSIGLESVLEYAVLEYWFYFFQYGNADCDQIPADDATPQEMFYYLDRHSPFSYYSDSEINAFMPFYYQANTQLGYYTFICDHLRDLLVAVPWCDHRLLAPGDVVMNYNSAVMEDISNWLRSHGNNIIYIYGAQDPYTATAVEPSAATNALKIIQPGADHLVGIYDLDQRELVFDTLEKWLKVPITRDYGMAPRNRRLRYR